MISLKCVGLVVIAAALSVAAPANAAETASAAMKSPDGKDVGSVELTQTPNGVLLSAKLRNLPVGTHAFHVHAVGKCEPPFKSAGGHYNPDGKKHGILVEGGMHAGDMPNVHVAENGSLSIEVLNAGITLKKGAGTSVFDADGSAIVMHAKGDDYKSQPSGAAGARIACGVIK